MKKQFHWALTAILLSSGIAFGKNCDILFENALLSGQALVDKIASDPKLAEIARYSYFKLKIVSPTREESIRVFNAIKNELGLTIDSDAPNSREDFPHLNQPSRGHIYFGRDIHLGDPNYIGLNFNFGSPDALTILKIVTNKTLLGNSTLKFNEDSIFTNSRSRSEPQSIISKNRLETLWGRPVNIHFNRPAGIDFEEYNAMSKVVLRAIEESYRLDTNKDDIITSVTLDVLKKGSLFSDSDSRLLYMSDLTFKTKITNVRDGHTHELYDLIHLLRRPISKTYRVIEIQPSHKNERVDH